MFLELLGDCTKMKVSNSVKSFKQITHKTAYKEGISVP